MLKKNVLFIMAIILGVVISKNSLCAPNLIKEDSLGYPNAPITIYEFTSFSCGHCAHFHKEVIPLIEANYVEKGLVKLIFSDYPMSSSPKTLAASMLLKCIPEKSAPTFISLLFENQEKWFEQKNNDIAYNYAMLSGLKKSQINDCLKNKELLAQIMQKKIDDDKKYNINGTPTLIIVYKNEKPITLEGARPYSLIAQVLDKLLEKK